jgi:hypothetical protein
MIRRSALGNEECIGDEDSLTPAEQRLFEIGLALEEAFRRDPSIAAMNRVYRVLRTGDARSDRAIRDHIGMLYLFEQARPALRQAMRRGKMAEGLDRGHRESGELEVASR